LIKSSNTNATAVLRKGTTSVIDLTPHHFSDWFELPRINYSYNGLKYNFTYGLRATETVGVTLPKADKITKINVADGSLLDYHIKGVMATEPIFVSNPSPTAEDDGILLAVILQDDPNDVNLVILNAKDMTEITNIKFTAKGPVTATFHGIFTPATTK